MANEKWNDELGSSCISHDADVTGLQATNRVLERFFPSTMQNMLLLGEKWGWGARWIFMKKFCLLE